MNTQSEIRSAIKAFLERWPQPNLHSEACQEMLVDTIYTRLSNDSPGTYNQDQLNFFTEFNDNTHK